MKKALINKTILITGGAGFIGSNFIYLILKERPDWKVVCVDSLTPVSNIGFLDEAFENPNFVFYKEDIRNKKGIFEIFKKEHPDIVVNFAAESHVDNSINNPGIFFETNVLGTQVLLDACREFGIKRFHQVSTDEVYGDIALDDMDTIFDENSPLHPSSPYSASKASADLLVLSYHRTYDLPVTISRCSNNYGPNQNKEKLIPMVIDFALKDKSIPIYGDGLNVRDWIYVQDHCRGILAILEKGSDGEIYNLCGNNQKTNLEIVKLILKELNKPQSLIEFVEDRKGHDKKYKVSYLKAKRELGWEPVTSFNESLKTIVAWYKKQYVARIANRYAILIDSSGTIKILKCNYT